MKRTRIIALASALLFMVLMGFWLLNGGKGNSVEVVAASREIPQNKLITKEALKKIEMPQELIHTNVIRDESEIVGKIARTPIFEDEVILKNHVLDNSSDEDSGSYGLARVIEKGKRGMSIEVSVPQGVSGMLKVGNYVDIVRTNRGEQNKGEKAASLFLQDIKIIGLESSLSDSGSGDGSHTYKTVTLELTPEAFTQLVFAISQGEVWLGLRPQGDHAKVNVAKVTTLG